MFNTICKNYPSSVRHVTLPGPHPGNTIYSDSHVDGCFFYAADHAHALDDMNPGKQPQSVFLEVHLRRQPGVLQISERLPAWFSPTLASPVPCVLYATAAIDF